ncbi:hypothetical protein ACFLTH_04180 [Bacteroidota bacterium]
MKSNNSNITRTTVIVGLVLGFYGCVDSIIEDSDSTLSPSISITSPVTGSGASVHVGMNKIIYTASDYNGGTGLNFFQVILNDNVNNPNFEDMVTNGVLPDLYLDIPASLLGSTISYYVIVYNIAGEFTSSVVQSNLLVREALPEAPYNLVIVPENIVTGDVRLIWDDSSENIIDYLIYQKVENGDWNQSGIVAAPQKTFSVRVNPMNDNFFKVAGWNASIGTIDDLKFSNQAGTGNVINLWDLSVEAIGVSKVVMSWDNPWGLSVMVFEIERTSGITGWDEVPDYYVIGSTETRVEYIDNTVLGNTSYAYRIRRRMSADDYRSAWSNEIAVFTLSSDIASPTGFSVTQSTPSSVRLVWDLSWIYTTQIEMTDNPLVSNPEYQLIDTKDSGLPVSAGSNQTEYIVSGLSTNLWYNFRIRYILGSNNYTDWKYSNNIYIN